MKKIIISSLLLVQVLFAKEFIVGVGGFDCYKSGKRYFVENKKIKQKSWCAITEALKVKSPNVNSVTIWITRNWKKEWFQAKDVNQYIIEKGYTPLFIFYWFNDDISKKYVLKHKKEYFRALDNFVEYLKDVFGKKIVVLNPEFNQKDIPSWRGFNSILIESIKRVRKARDVKVGFCVGDFGNYNYVNEPKEWALFDKSINRAVKYADFIAFQEMRALTRNKNYQILNTPYRALEFAKYLHRKYKKPTLLAYSAISSYGYNGEEIQKEVLKSYADLMPNFKREGGMVGWNFFHYWDMPKQVGYFKKAEKYFGVFTKEGRAKKGLKYFNKIE